MNKYSLLHKDYYLKVLKIKEKIGIGNFATYLDLPTAFIHKFEKGELIIVPRKFTSKIKQFVTKASIKLRIKNASIYVLPRLLNRYGII
jgi:hypothetical protein